MFVKKESHELTGAMTKRQFDAACYAYCINRRLNLFLTIHCERAGISKWNGNGSMSHLLKLASDWNRRQSSEPLYYVGVFESDGGLNFHLLVHVADHLQEDLRNHLKPWLRTAGAMPKTKVLKTMRVKFSRVSDDPDKYLREGLLGLLRYICKGTEKRACAVFGIQHKAQGIVIGRRALFSQALVAGRRKWSHEARFRREDVRLAGYPMGD